MAGLRARRVAVIGAGVSGVTTAAHLISEGVDVTVFERGSISGGVWIWYPERPFEPTYPSPKASVAESTFFDVPENSDPYLLHSGPGPCYEGLKNNVPTELLELSINKWKPNTESFVLHNILAEYIQDTAAFTGTDNRTLFDTRVEHIGKNAGVWEVKTRTWDHATKTSEPRNWTFDGVVVASGHYHAPKVPDIPGLAEWKRGWPSRVQHSKSYRNVEGLEHKTVLLIGGSASSTDIAMELAPVAKKVWQSTRGGAFDHSPSMLPENAERVGPIARFDGLQAGLFGDADPIPGTITLTDGRVLTDIDRVIVATGYQFSLPFLPEYHRDDALPENADDHVLITDGLQLHNLHKDIFYIPDPTLTFVGVPFYTATFSLFEFQAIAVSAYFSGQATLPSEEEMKAEYKARVEEKGYGKKFHSLWGKDVEYAAELMAWVNQGREGPQRRPDGYSPEWIEAKEKMVKLANKKNILYEENQPPVVVD